MNDHVTSAPLVVYLRRRPAEPEASTSAFDQQYDALTGWLASRAPVPPVLREVIEDESDGAARPALAEAVALCKTEQATLVIVSTQPIGTGKPFEPRIASVPVTILPQPERPIPVVIPLPPCTGDDVVLYVDRAQNGYWPVYLVNPMTVSLTEVTVDLGGFYTAVSHTESVIPLSGSTKALACVEPRTGQLIEPRNIMMEGESIDYVHVQFREAEQVRRGGAYLPRLSAPRFVALTFRPVPDGDVDQNALRSGP